MVTFSFDELQEFIFQVNNSVVQEWTILHATFMLHIWNKDNLQENVGVQWEGQL